MKKNKKKDSQETKISSLNNPHDKFFREQFRVPERAAAYLDKILPEKVRANIDLNGIKLGKDSFIDEYLQNFFCDVTYLGTCEEF